MSTAAIEQVPLASKEVRRRPLPRHFFTWMAVVCMLTALGGFAPTYWLPVSQGTYRAAPIFHIHGWLFSFWTVFFVVQSALAASGRIARHRAVGIIGVSLATMMVIVGFIAAIYGLRHGLALGFGERAMEFSIVPVSSLVLFAGFFIAAIANVRRPEVHKRLMLIATVSLLQAALGRIFPLFLAPPEVLKLPFADRPPPPVVFSVGPGLVVALLIVAGMVADWRTRGRAHPAYVIGGAIFLAVEIGRVPLSATAAWHAVASGMLALAG